MGMMNTNSLQYDMSGRRRKTKKAKGATYAKKYKPKFQEYKPEKSVWAERIEAIKSIPSRMDDSTKPRFGTPRKESSKYTGDYVIGIGQLHKSNAVPVTNPKYAKEIADMY